MIDRLPRDAEPEEAGWFTPAGAAGCVSPDLLFAARGDSVPADVAARVEAHLSRCPTCRALLEALVAVHGDPTMEGEQRINASIERRTRRRVAAWHPEWLAAAALVIATIGLALMMAGSNEPGPLAKPPAHDRELRGDPFALVLEKPDVELPADALALRGETSAGTPYVAALSAALDAWNENRFEEAAAKLRELTRRHPDRPHAFYYLGTSLLVLHRPADAVDPLQRARELAAHDPVLRDSVTWYLAVSFERNGDTAAAIQALADLCAGGGTRRDESCRGLAELAPLNESGARHWEKPGVRGPAVGSGDRFPGGSSGPGTAVPFR